MFFMVFLYFGLSAPELCFVFSCFGGPRASRTLYACLRAAGWSPSTRGAQSQCLSHVQVGNTHDRPRAGGEPVDQEVLEAARRANGSDGKDTRKTNALVVPGPYIRGYHYQLIKMDYYIFPIFSAATVEGIRNSGTEI